MAKETLKSKTLRAIEIFNTLTDHYPPLSTFLTHRNSFELLIAVILSAQCTDERVNATTPELFQTFPTPDALSKGDLDAIKTCIKSINFFNTKAKNIKQTSTILVNQFEGRVPRTLDELVSLPGVGRKTANVVLGQAFGIPGITVDTHVNRLSRRMGFTKKREANKVEEDLQKVWPQKQWTDMSSYIIYHGRQACMARKPLCETCIVNHLCPKLIEIR